MPPMFSRSKQSSHVAPSISQPMPYNPAVVNDYRGEALLMQVPKTPPPSHPYSRPTKPVGNQASNGRKHKQTTVSQVVDLYTPVAEKGFRAPDSEYSDSVYEDESVSQSSSTLAAEDRYTGSAWMKNPSLSRSDSTRPFLGAPSHHGGQSGLNRAPTNANRLLTSHVVTLARALYFAEVATQPHFEPQPVQTRTDTRMQGRWLQLGTRRGVAARKLYKEVTEERAHAEKARAKLEKAELKVRTKMMREALKAERRK